MYKKILVPLDGSKLAEVILPHAIELARLFQSEIHYLQVFQLSHSVYIRQSNSDKYAALPDFNAGEFSDHVAKAEAYLEKQAQKTRELGIPSITHIAYGPVAAAIMNTAIEEAVDLIAMASHGASGVQGVYYGSVAAGVLQRVDRPLLIVRSHETP